MDEPLISPTQKSLTYASYLRVDELLKLQTPVSDPVEHDEMLFIVIHQVYELWFRQLLHEFDKLGRDFRENRMHGAMSTLKRIRTIMKTLVGQLDVLETMTPMDFNSFRDRLESASGFQSAQFREFEFLLGYKRTPMMKYHDRKSTGYAALERRLNEPSIVDHFYVFLEHQGYKVPAELLNRDVTQPTAPHPAVQEAALQIYKTRPDVSVLLELMVDFDEGLQEWRYRHVKMVERTIGVKMGTGGSSGVDFLKKTLFMPVFPDLWEIRHRL
jgi:tryptophan 2,3-dioxygenase